MGWSHEVGSGDGEGQGPGEKQAKLGIHCTVDNANEYLILHKKTVVKTQLCQCEFPQEMGKVG